MLSQLLIALALVASPNEAVQIVTQEVYQGSGCSGTAVVVLPAYASGVCLSFEGGSAVNTCGHYEGWNNTECAGTPKDVVDYTQCMDGESDEVGLISYVYKCVEMSAPVLIKVGQSVCSEASRTSMEFVASVGACTPMPHTLSDMSMETSFKLTKTGNEYELSYYPSSTTCQGEAQVLSSIALGVCLDDSDLPLWTSVTLTQIEETATSAPATTRTASPKASSASGVFASQLLLALAAAAAL